MSTNLLSRKRELAEALLAGQAPQGAEALGELRAKGKARFLEMGAPVRRDEYWRYFDPSAFTKPLQAAADGAAGGGEDPFSAAEPLTLVFSGGRFRADLSDDLSALPGLTIAPLSEAAGRPWAAKALVALESRGQEPVQRPFAALNTALMGEGVALRVEGAVQRPVRIQHASAEPGASYSRMVVSVAEGASLTLLENDAGAERRNTVAEFDIAAGGALNHVRLQSQKNAQAQTLSHIFASLEAQSSFKSFTLSEGCGTARTRNEFVVWLDGDDASAHLAGGVIGSSAAVIDNTIFLTHGALRGESRQVFKNVLNDKAQAIFQGKILVREGAQKTDGYQMSQSVLLSEDAAFNAKPELEIYADDVACSHGSTTGALDETALFYLRSRGVAPDVARRLLIEAFLADAIEEIADEGLREIVETHARALTAEALGLNS